LNERSNGVTLTADETALTLELVRYAIEELSHTIEMAEQRRHMPVGLRAYRADALLLMARLA
jgi:hypothetical protein